MRCLDVSAEWVDKEGGREEPEENPFKEGETDALMTCGVRGGDNVCVYHGVSAPPQEEKVFRRGAADRGLTHAASVSHLPLPHRQTAPTSH